MITRAMIKAEKEYWKIGQDIVVQIFHIMSEGGRKQAPCFRKFKVLAKTDRMLIVGNGKYKVSVLYADTIRNRLDGIKDCITL